MPTPTPRFPRLRALLYAALALALLDGLWIGAGALLVRSGRVAGWLAHRPDRFQASFESLSSPLPGLLVARGLDLSGQTERLRWQVTADRAWGVIDPFALLTRELRFITLHGDGVEVRGYRIARAETVSGAGMPPIPEFPRPAAPPKPRRLPWSWEFPDLRLSAVRELWIEEARLAGPLDARGGFALRRRREAEILSSVVDLRAAHLTVAGTPGGEIGGRLRFAISPYPYRGATPSVVLPHLDARFAASGTFEASRLGDHFLRGVPWIDLSGPPSPFTADLRVEQGHLLAGSRARFEPPSQQVTVFGVALVGSGSIDLAASRDGEGDRCDVALRFTRFEALDGDRAVLMRGTGLHAELATRDLTLDGPPKDLALAFDLGRGELPDLAELGGLLPSSSNLKLSGGHGAVTGAGTVSSLPHSARGRLEVRLAGVDVAYGDARMRGDLRATAVISDGDLASRRFALDGTEIVAERFLARSATGSEEGWFARAALPTAALDLGAPRRVNGTFILSLRDTGPLVAVYDERRDLPRWAERALSIDDASAQGSFEWRQGELTLPAFWSRHGDATADGSLSLRGGRAEARLLLTWKQLAAGVELRGGERTLHLRRARDWYAGKEERAAGTASPPRRPSRDR